MKITTNPWLEDYIKKRLALYWTPEQVAGRLKFENNNVSVISFKSIYNWLGTVWGQDLVKYLPYKKPYRRKKKAKGKKEIIKNRVFIEHRPDEINNRERLKDFEADVLGTTKRETARLAGLVDRQARYLAVKKVPRLKEAMAAYDEILKSLNGLSVTLDNGPENSSHERLGIPVFFCHSYSSWEKGTMENSFQRLRRFIPKKSKLSKYTDEQLSAIVDVMNNTPRKCLGFKTPKEVFFSEPIQFTISKFQLAKCCTSG
jgi:IS30 family transposase